MGESHGRYGAAKGGKKFVMYPYYALPVLLSYMYPYYALPVLLSHTQDTKQQADIWVAAV